jgi:hypothetical protein
VLKTFCGGKHLSEDIGAAVSFDRVYAFAYGSQRFLFCLIAKKRRPS